MTRLFCVLTLLGVSAVAQTVEGVVINSATGNGIAAVRVELRPAAGGKDYGTTTDAQGRFFMEGVNPGVYAFGYQTREYLASDPVFPRIIQVGAASSAVKLEGCMLPVPTISGRVVDGRGDPVANARLAVIGQGQRTGTDANGRFELRVPPGAHILSVVPPVATRKLFGSYKSP